MDPRLPLRDVPAYAQRVEALGFDGLHVAETIHDALAVALLACEHTSGITIRTSVALAFVRSPTLVAYTAWDLAQFSGGRFQLGLGTQIRQNVVERMGMPWSSPVRRMREFVEALGALYDAFATGGRVTYEGESYRITRLQPYFNPGPSADVTPPPTWLGGVNPGMCRLAGELAAGFVTHPTNSSPTYLTDVCWPSLREGAGARPLDDFELVAGPTVITGPDAAAVAAERARQRELLSFLYTTPAYQPELERHGLTGAPIDDVIDALVPVGRYDELGPVLRERYDGLAHGLVLPPVTDPGVAEVVDALRAP